MLGYLTGLSSPYNWGNNFFGGILSRRTAHRKNFRTRRWAITAALAFGGLAAGGFVAAEKLAPEPTLAEVTAAAESIQEIPGDNPAVILTPKQESRGIVLYVHGNRQTEREVLSGRNVAPLTAKLLDAGYTVVSSFGAGNAWGNQESVGVYRQIVAHVRSMTDADDLYIMGESMGGLASLQLAASVPDVKAWVGFYPVCDARSVMGQEDLREGIESAYPSGVGIETVTPVTMPSVPMAFWHSPDDTRVSKAENTDKCAADARKAGAQVAVTTTTGNHGDPSNFDAEQIISFFNAS